MEKKTLPDYPYFQPEPLAPSSPPTRHHRWVWARRLVLSLAAFTIVMHCLPVANVQLLARPAADTPKQLSQAHIVLRTGFPPIDRPVGQPIAASGASAAVAFSPQPASLLSTATLGGESWWDRLFPRSHVHLTSVQLALLDAASTTRAKLSVCSSTHDRLWQTVPDDLHCVVSAEVQVAPLEEGDVFGILDWTPEETVVLQRRQVYWLVVEAVDTPFRWAFAQAGINEYGSALETTTGWQLQSEDDPVPSVMVTVAEH